jgi:hypothetical protein
MNRQMNIWFPWPQTKCLDAAFYQQIGAMFSGKCVEENDGFASFTSYTRSKKDDMIESAQAMGGIPFSGLVGQYKGVHAARLMHHEEEAAWEGAYDTYEARQITPREIIYSMVWRYGKRGLFQEAKRICKLGLEIYPDDQLLLNSLNFNEGANNV